MKNLLTTACFFLIANGLTLAQHRDTEGDSLVKAAAAATSGGIDLLSVGIGVVVGLLIGYLVGSKMSQK